MLAYELRESMTIDPIYPGKKRQKIVHIVHENGKIIVSTDEGIHFFNPTEMVRFPRRKDGSLRNWIGQTPRFDQIVPGDTLDPEKGLTDEQHENNPYEGSDEEWEGTDRDYLKTIFPASIKNPQFVHALWHAGHGVIGVTLSSGYEILGLPHEKIQFPARTVERIKYSGPKVVYAWHGPYMRSLGAPHVFFASRRGGTGKGRWPSYIPEYDDRGSGRMRPPSHQSRPAQDTMFGKKGGHPNRAEWGKWVYGGPPGQHHPKDLIRKKRMMFQQEEEE